MIIRFAEKEDALQISQIHCREINQGFLRIVGIPFLTLLYQALIASPYSFVVIAKKNNTLIGFVSGATSIKKIYLFFIKKYGLRAFFILLPKLFTPALIKKLLNIITYPHRRHDQHKPFPRAELMSIAIAKEYQGSGVAQKLVRTFIEEMKKRNIDQFKVLVGESLPRAIQFYEKMGFVFHRFTAVHKNKQSRIYIYTM